MTNDISLFVSAENRQFFFVWVLAKERAKGERMKDLRGYLIDGTPMKKESIFGMLILAKSLIKKILAK